MLTDTAALKTQITKDATAIKANMVKNLVEPTVSTERPRGSDRNKRTRNEEQRSDEKKLRLSPHLNFERKELEKLDASNCWKVEIRAVKA